jgi:biotin carboxyl carrier protein
VKLNVQIDDGELNLYLQQQGAATLYRADGCLNSSGEAAIAQISPNVFSVMLESRSFTVYCMRSNDGSIETLVGSEGHIISVSDPRDAISATSRHQSSGPTEIRAQMPGKIISLLVNEGATVEAGEGILVVEAMKMQNELKSPRSGILLKMLARAGATVTAGETLAVIG